jgi:hypothetical protein
MAMFGSISGGRGVHMTLPMQFRKITTRLNKEIINIKVASARGLIMAAAHIRVETETKVYSTPVDLGNLRASWFIVSVKGEAVDPVKHTPFKNNKKRRIPAAQFKAWHTAAVAEAKGMTGGNPNRIKVFMGYSANYALWVHEMVGANFQRTDPEAGPKWFEEAVDRNHDKMLQIIAETSKIPK